MATERREANPFATSRTRPGALAYRLESDAELARLLADIASHSAMQIVGPHGIGKSTLVRTLLKHLAARGWKCALLRVGPGQRRWQATQIEPYVERRDCESPHPQSATQAAHQACLFVDGYEQLSWWSKRTLRTFARRSKQTLVVTCHHDVGLPVLARPKATMSQLWELVELLQAGYPALIRTDDVDQLWQLHPGNIREILFGLYDLYETRRTAPKPPSNS